MNRLQRLLSKRQFVYRLWHVARPYWDSSEKWGAWGLLIMLSLLSLVSASLLVIVSIFLGEVTSALASQDSDRFRQSVLLFIGVIIVGVPLLSLKLFVQAQLGLYWRRWLTQEILGQYFSDRQFYKINAHLNPQTNIDNPDQRIAEDINIFTQQALFFLIAFLDSCLQLLAFIGVLWGISKPLMAILVAYALGGTVVTGVVFGRKLIHLNVEQLKREANFRFGLVRVRENAEAIALYDGQDQELSILKQRFQSLFSNFNHLIRWQLGLNFFQNGYQYLTFLLPALLLARPILNGTMEVGVQSQAVIAFRSILIALAVIIQQFEKLAEFIARGDRLYDLSQALRPEIPPLPSTTSSYTREGTGDLVSFPTIDTAHSENVGGSRRGIQVIESPHIALDHLTLYTPDGTTQVLSDLSLTVKPGRSLLIQGPSGVGKSSLLRAIAGLWQVGTGTIRRPPLNQLVFLPQRPYMALGTLRQQLMYPLDLSIQSGNGPINEEGLQEILDQVNLSSLSTQYDGWESIENWSQILSVGEQQRLAIARLLFSQSVPPASHELHHSGANSPSVSTPHTGIRYALLDEATSALDAENEALIYHLLNNQTLTLISIGHRPSLVNYHDEVLDLEKNQAWSVR